MSPPARVQSPWRPHPALIVGADGAIVETLEAICRTLHLTPRVTRDKEEAFEAFTADPRYCLILADLHIPPARDLLSDPQVGILFVAEVRACGFTRERLPIVALTTEGAETPYASLAEQAGANVVHDVAQAGTRILDLSRGLRALLEGSCERYHPTGCPNLSASASARTRTYTSQTRIKLVGEAQQRGLTILVGDGRTVALSEQHFLLLFRLWRYDLATSGDGFIAPQGLLSLSPKSARRAVQRLEEALEKCDLADIVETSTGNGVRIATPHVDWNEPLVRLKLAGLMDWVPPA